MWYWQGHASLITLPSAVMIILLCLVTTLCSVTTAVLSLLWLCYAVCHFSVITTAIYLYVMSITIPWQHSYNSLSKVYESFSQVRSDDVVNLITKKWSKNIPCKPTGTCTLCMITIDSTWENDCMLHIRIQNLSAFYTVSILLLVHSYICLLVAIFLDSWGWCVE